MLPRASLPSPDMTIWVLVSFLTPLCYGMAKLTNAQKADVKRVATLRPRKKPSALTTVKQSKNANAAAV